MALVEKVRYCWKMKFSTEIPAEFITRLECQICKNNTGNVPGQGVDEVNILSQVLIDTTMKIKELATNLRTEEFYLEVLSNMISDEKEENVDRIREKCLQPNEDVPDSARYAQVNTVSQQTCTEVQKDVIAGNLNSVTVHSETSKCVSGDESRDYAEISLKCCTDSRGSTKHRIKLFENSDSSASEISPGVEGEHAQQNSSPASHQKINEYEEEALPLSLQWNAVSLSNPDMQSLHLQSSDNSHEEKLAKPHLQTKQKGFTPLPHCMQETGANKNNNKQKGLPILAKRGSYLEKENLGNNLKKTEELTLKHSEREPQEKLKKLVISNLRSQKVESGVEKNNNTLYQETDFDCLKVSEGGYCSIQDVTSGTKDKHTMIVNVTSFGQKGNINRNSKPKKELSCSSEDVLNEDYRKLNKSSSFSKSLDDLNDEKSFGEYCGVKETAPSSSNNNKMKKLMGHKKSFSISGDKVKHSHDVEDVKETHFRSTQDFSQIDFNALKDKSLSISNNKEESSNMLVTSKIRKTNSGKTKRVPDYEKWNIQTLVTQTGISIADNDNLTDTGSDEDTGYDNVMVTDKHEHNFGQIDDSGVCEVTSIPDEQSQQDEISCDILEESVDSGELSNIHNPRTFSCITVDVDTDGIVLQRCDTMDGIIDDDKVSLYSNDDMVDADDALKDDVVTKQLRMRHLVIKGILESEKSYLHVIDQLIKAKHYLQTSELNKKDNQGTIAMEDITTIFYKMGDFHQIHKQFVDDLEKQLVNWTDDTQIAHAVMQLVVHFKCYKEYVQNYPKAVETIQKYQKIEETRQLLEEQVHDATKKEETLKLEEVLLKPVQRIQTNHLVLHDLIKHTPVHHPDYVTLCQAQKLSEENLKMYTSLNYNKKEETRHLVKSGFVVEVSLDKRQTRYLRYVLLFNDILICTKYKGSLKQKDATIKYVWSLPIATLCVHAKGDQQYEQKESLEELKIRIGALKCELRDEMLKVDTVKEKAFSITQHRTARNVEKLKKKIQEQEATLIEGLPQLPLHLNVEEIKQQEAFKQHSFLFSTDYERVEWREALESQHEKCQGMPMVQLSAHDCEVLINHTKVHMQINSIGTMLLKKDEDMLNGNLNVTIHKMQGPLQSCDVYCCLEIDSYGHFYKKAQTTVSHFMTDASWNEDFELELDGSQTLRILCYKKRQSLEEDIILAKCALELSMAWLDSKFNEKTIVMNEICLTISIRHTPASTTLKRTQSKLKTGIFGVKIETITRREQKTVPSIVTICVQQVEKRELVNSKRSGDWAVFGEAEYPGPSQKVSVMINEHLLHNSVWTAGLQELGIYRISGVTSDIVYFKKLFDKNVNVASTQIDEADINAVTGILKLYFRELPEPLFTNSHYHQFLQTMQLENEDGKEKCMLELLHSLPDPNYYTIVYMIEHLIRVSAQSAENKMSIENLSTIFGPTLMHPAVKEASTDPLVKMAHAAKDASLQCEAIHFFLKLAASGKTLRKSAAVVTSHF